ncbi:MAG: helix-turn-helix domain-containing protein [Promethearchaeota archaeon]
MEISPNINLSNKNEKPQFKSHTPLEEKLVDLLRKGPMTRGEMVKRLNIPRTTIYDGLKSLILRNEVKKYPLYHSKMKRGRPNVVFELNQD